MRQQDVKRGLVDQRIDVRLRVMLELALRQVGWGIVKISWRIVAAECADANDPVADIDGGNLSLREKMRFNACS